METKRILEGKTIIVTGGGRGIGRGIALECARQGARVVVNDLGAGAAGEGADASPAQSVADEIRAMGGEAIADTSSVAEWASAHRIIENALDNFGAIDGVVNNAGILSDVIFHKMTEEQFDKVMRVNLYGPFFMSRAAAPHFKKQESGAFVHMTSTSGLIGNLGQANYSAAKLGLVGLSKSIALDMGRSNVRSNCIAPFAWTRMVGTIQADTPEQQRRVDGLKKLVPERVAPFTAALFSDAAKDVTGQIFGVRNNEIMLFSQPRPIRFAHTAEGWTPESVIERVLPMMRPSFFPLDRSGDVFTWDPV
ncbi:MAG: SDR family NAD(P)-dependent oxidoreductase [Pseudomonadota bacterium]